MHRDESCLYTLMRAPSESHDALLREFVHPVVREIAGAPELDSIFFARYSEPDYQLRFRVLGRPAWVDGPVRRRIEEGLAPMRAAGLLTGAEFASYEREWDRYGGEAGMPLAEKIFFHDSLAALSLVDVEGRGGFHKTRREWSLLFTERFLDLFGFDRDTRTEFYRFSHSWAIKDGDWGEQDMRALDAKFEALKPGLTALLAGGDGDEAWGGEEPARIARGALDATRPYADQVTAGLRSGAIPQDPIYLVWSYTHMHANRLGIWAMAEAIVRYFMWRLYSDTEVGAT
jgi:class I lanthipeptide synthase